MPLKNLTLLFIEDDITTQEHIKMFLEEDVKELYQAYDAKQGYSIYKEKAPDIIITDINLPFYSGLELTAKIKQKDASQVVIIISAYDDKENLLASINLGNDGFITKPVDMDLLYTRLHLSASQLDKQKEQKDEHLNKIKELHNLAHYDPLTQLPNRLLFNKELLKSIETAEEKNLEFSLFFIDLDNFKAINDTFGHDAGDFVLQTTAKNISQAIEKDDIVSRRGGDEFLILVKNYHSTQDLETIANRILQRSSQTLLWKGQSIEISCSIGISQYPKDTKNKNKLIALADTAMYNAKHLGKGNYFLAQNNFII